MHQKNLTQCVSRARFTGPRVASDVLFRNLARAVDGMPLIESDSVLGANGNKWEAHAGATAPGQFCAFDTAQGRAVRNFYTDFANEVV